MFLCCVCGAKAASQRWLSAIHLRTSLTHANPQGCCFEVPVCVGGFPSPPIPQQQQQVHAHAQIPSSQEMIHSSSLLDDGAWLHVRGACELASSSPSTISSSSSGRRCVGSDYPQPFSDEHDVESVVSAWTPLAAAPFAASSGSSSSCSIQRGQEPLEEAEVPVAVKPASAPSEPTGTVLSPRDAAAVVGRVRERGHAWDVQTRPPVKTSPRLRPVLLVGRLLPRNDTARASDRTAAGTEATEDEDSSDLGAVAEGQPTNPMRIQTPRGKNRSAVHGKGSYESLGTAASVSSDGRSRAAAANTLLVPRIGQHNTDISTAQPSMNSSLNGAIPRPHHCAL